MKVLIGSNPMGLEKAIPDLQVKYPDVTFEHCPERDKTTEAIADADVYVGWMNRDVFLAAKKLKWVQSPSSGINYYLAIPEFVEGDVLLTSARGTHGACLAESVFAMILAYTRGICSSLELQAKKEYSTRKVRGGLLELTDMTLGIVGLGMVGRSVAERAAAFNMNIIAVDMFPNNKPEYVSELWGLDRLDEMLGVADFVVVTVPYTPDTDHMIGAEQIGAMKETAMLVGISRGKIIDEAALAAALHDGKLAFAALDVFAHEPLPEDDPLWDAPNLIITPHAAGGTQYEGKYILEILYENLAKFLSGDLPLRNQIDKVRGF